MEANEAQELQENAEHAEHESSLRPVALTMTVLAVLVAVTTVLGHRTHTGPSSTRTGPPTSGTTTRRTRFAPTIRLWPRICSAW